MGRHNNKENKIDTKGLKQLLGRIFRPRHMEENDLPFLLVKERSVRVDLKLLIDAITGNPTYDDCQIVGTVGVSGVRPSDIEVVRAYIHRFGSDVRKPLSIEDHPNRTLLLDENTPQPAMLHLSKNFGWATHVAAEELSGRDTPDQDIWQFARREKFAAIVTRDTDFLYIQEHLGQEALDQGEDDVPLLIFVTETLSTESLSALFVKHAKELRRHIAEKSYLVCDLGSDLGCKPRF
jgi:predicted nuclease of predicted toxin-antitoxin system